MLIYYSDNVIVCCQFSSVPPDYNDVYVEMARRGARVLALGYKPLGVLSHQQVGVLLNFFLPNYHFSNHHVFAKLVS